MANRSDNFNRADNDTTLGTPSDGGSAWVALVGVWGVIGNRGYDKNGTAQDIAYLEASTANAEVQATISTVGTDMGLSARIVNSSNYLLLAGSPSGVFLYKQVSGSFSLLGSYTTTGLANGDVLKLRCDGNNLTAYVNGVSRITATDSAHNTATKFGLRANDSGATRFDDFSITDLAGGGTTPVQQDLSASYTVIAPVQSDLAASYAVRTSAQSDLAASYEILPQPGILNLTFATDVLGVDMRNYTFTWIKASNISTGTTVATWTTGITTDSSAQLSLSNAALVAGTKYNVNTNGPSDTAGAMVVQAV